jgi:hypothetical protein
MKTPLRNIRILLSQLVRNQIIYKDFYKGLRQQILKSKECNTPLYFVRTDIVDAYGSVLPDKLLQILHELLPDRK